MSSGFLGLSNTYLKVGVLLVAVSLALLVVALVAPSVGGVVINQLFGALFFAGVILYVIGRIVKVRRSRAAA